MEHNPLMTLNDDTVITYSDLKYDHQSSYITLYFETPTDAGFNSAECRVPGCQIENIKGYTPGEVRQLKYHAEKAGYCALAFAKEADKFVSVFP